MSLGQPSSRPGHSGAWSRARGGSVSRWSSEAGKVSSSIGEHGRREASCGAGQRLLPAVSRGVAPGLGTEVTIASVSRALYSVGAVVFILLHALMLFVHVHHTKLYPAHVRACYIILQVRTSLESRGNVAVSGVDALPGRLRQRPLRALPAVPAPRDGVLRAAVPTRRSAPRHGY